jgi:hypothetical protein
MFSRHVSTLCISSLGPFHPSILHELAKDGVHVYATKQDMDVSEVQNHDK